MRLIEAQVQMYRNILDSTAVAIDPDVTCLVGKNESGKTAFLEALRGIKPAPTQGAVTFSIHTHYPAWREKADRQSQDLNDARVARATFELDDDDRAALDDRFGSGVVTGTTVTVSHTYGGRRLYGYKAEEEVAIANLVRDLGLPSGIASQAQDAKTFKALQSDLTVMVDSRRGGHQKLGAAWKSPSQLPVRTAQSFFRSRRSACAWMS